VYLVASIWTTMEGFNRVLPKVFIYSGTRLCWFTKLWYSDRIIIIIVSQLVTHKALHAPWNFPNPG